MSIGDARKSRTRPLRGVTRVYPGVTPVHALGPLDLDLARGEFFSVVTARPAVASPRCWTCWLELNPPTTGTVGFEGRAVVGDVPNGIGVVFRRCEFPVF